MGQKRGVGVYKVLGVYKVIYGININWLYILTDYTY